MSTQTTFPPLVIRQPAAEQVRVPVIVHDGGDPTGAVVSFALIAEDTDPESGDWTAGSWGPWNARGQTADAITPTIGGTGSGATWERTHGRWVLWVRIEFPFETPVRRVVLIIVC